MQTSALSFSVCFDLNQERFEKLLAGFSEIFKIKYNSDLTLITVRHYKLYDLKGLVENRSILLEQVSRNTAQMVVK